MKLKEQLQPLFSELETQYNLPTGLLDGIAHTESRYNPNAVSPVGAKGLFQFMPATAKQYGVDTTDPISSAKGAAKMMRQLIDSNDGDLQKAVASYNWGIGNVQKKGLDKMPEETKKYIPAVLNRMNMNTQGNDMKFTPEEIAQFEQRKLQESQPQFTPEEIAQFKQRQKEEESARAMASQQTLPPSALPKPPSMPDSGVNGGQESMSSQASNLVLNPQITQPKPANPDLLAQIESRINGMKPEDALKLVANLTGPSRTVAIEAIKKGQAQETSSLFKAYQGFGNAATDITNAGNQIVSRLPFIGSKEKQQAIDQKILEDKNMRRLQEEIDPSKIRDVAEIGTQIATGIAMPGGAAINLGKKGLATLAAKGAAGAVATNPVAGGDDFIEQKAGQAAIGGVLAPVAGVASEKLIRPGLEYLARKASTVLGKSENELVQKAFEKLGVKQTGVDIPNVDETLLSKAKVLAKSNPEVKEAAQKQASTLQGVAENLKDTSNKYESSKLIENLGLDKAKTRTKEAQQTINELKNATSENPDELLKSVAKGKLLSSKIKSDELYDEASKLAPKDLRIQQFESKNVLADIKKEIDKTNSPELKATLNKAYNNLSSQVSTEANIGGKQMTVIKKPTLEEANQSIKELGNLQRQAKEAKDDVLANMYGKMKTAFVNDQDNYVNSLAGSAKAKDFVNAYNTAKKFNATEVQAIKNDPMLSKVFNDKDKFGNPIATDKMIENIVQKGKPDQVKKVFDYLPEEGKDAVRTGTLNKLINESTKDEVFNPKTFMSKIGSYKTKSTEKGNVLGDVVFNPQQKDTLNNFAKVVQNMKIYDEAVNIPNNGAKNMEVLNKISDKIGLKTVGTLLAGGAAAGGTAGAAVLAAGAGAAGVLGKKMLDENFMKHLLSNKDTQKKFMKLSTLNPKSEKYLNLLDETLADIPGAYITNELNK